MHQTDAGPAALSRAGPTQTLPHLVPRWLGGRRGLMIGGAAIVAAGLASGWGRITAIGAAPILISLAPCLVMCALGLCMPRMMRGNSRAPGRSAGDTPGPISGAEPSSRSTSPLPTSRSKPRPATRSGSPTFAARLSCSTSSTRDARIFVRCRARSWRRSKRGSTEPRCAISCSSSRSPPTPRTPKTPLRSCAATAPNTGSSR